MHYSLVKLCDALTDLAKGESFIEISTGVSGSKRFQVLKR